MWNLKGKNVVITGASKGIGAAAVNEALSLGARVIAVARGEKAMMALAEELSGEPDFEHFTPVLADITSEEGRKKIADAVELHFSGYLHALVNNAGTNIRKKLNEYQKEEWQSIWKLNQTAGFELCRLMEKYLIASAPASVVNVASVAAFMDVRSGTPYAMSKAAMLQMTRSLASEWASLGVRVNSVSPWYTKTPLVAPILEDQSRYQKIIERTPLGRFAEPREVATAICFLLMDASSYITGQNIITDGGMSIQAL